MPPQIWNEHRYLWMFARELNRLFASEEHYSERNGIYAKEAQS